VGEQKGLWVEKGKTKKKKGYHENLNEKREGGKGAGVEIGKKGTRSPEATLREKDWVEWKPEEKKESPRWEKSVLGVKGKLQRKVLA